MFCSARWPLATKSPLPDPRVLPKGGATPSVNCAMYTQFRPLSGVSLMALVLITWPDRGLLRLQQRGCRGDLHGLGNRARREGEIHIQMLLDVEMKVFVRDRLKAWSRMR